MFGGRCCARWTISGGKVGVLSENSTRLWRSKERGDGAGEGS